jgi:hypothetical protein
MNSAKKLSGVAIAAAAATLFATAPVTVQASSYGSAKGHCVGVNACKGMSSCATADSKCKGMNACKGQGYVKATAEACKQLGGTFEAH